MIRINLLPFRAARSKENVRRQVSIFLLSLVLLMVLLFAVNGYFSSKVTKLTKRFDALKEELKTYEKKANQVEEFKKRLAELNKKIDIVNQLKTHRKDPPLLLAAITEVIVPGRMQLTRFDLNNKTLKMDGVAMDNETIAVFMSRLQRSPLFSGVSLSSSRQAELSGIEVNRFGITCNIAGQNGATKDKAK